MKQLQIAMHGVAAWYFFSFSRAFSWYSKVVIISEYISSADCTLVPSVRSSAYNCAIDQTFESEFNWSSPYSTKAVVEDKARDKVPTYQSLSPDIICVVTMSILRVT
jgi:hypothetical protein